MRRREVVSLVSFTSVIVSAIVRCYLKESVHTTLMRKWGFMLKACVHSLDHVSTPFMTTNLKWSFFWMTLRGTPIPTFKKSSYAHTGSLGHTSDTQVRGTTMYWSLPLRLKK